MNTMTHRGYHARIEYDGDDELFFGRITGIQDVVGFHGDTVAELKAAFHDAVDDYIDACARIGKDPQKPYSGKVMFRVDPETHRAAAIAADLAGKSLNQWAEEVLARAAGQDNDAQVRKAS
ncbi:type II toxin-antitoxin system HicB family antitoxin [Hoeflea ulvae]|uniref:Type II toxin-antitoxin system HicB family antitoxin n=1 Tax=Hoeflea ulvae TaxID=2983764 RepID=A0ABT3YIE1_9HYPH|nr:type II toxin-antitoxin system HicB family antitoxin [Hoeflea ulvae]MCY0095665.1 type II toxin-antitoxin system HicB family antitoxin [Hoeflea ulvae]